MINLNGLQLFKPINGGVVNRAVWFVCTARNAIVVILCLLLAFALTPDIELCQAA